MFILNENIIILMYIFLYHPNFMAIWPVLMYSIIILPSGWPWRLAANDLRRDPEGPTAEIRRVYPPVFFSYSYGESLNISPLYVYIHIYIYIDTYISTVYIYIVIFGNTH